jgi:hypothetical protein
MLRLAAGQEPNGYRLVPAARGGRGHHPAVLRARAQKTGTGYDLPCVQAQIGHTHPAVTPVVYARVSAFRGLNLARQVAGAGIESMDSQPTAQDMLPNCVLPRGSSPSDLDPTV